MLVCVNTIVIVHACNYVYTLLLILKQQHTNDTMNKEMPRSAEVLDFAADTYMQSLIQDCLYSNMYMYVCVYIYIYIYVCMVCSSIQYDTVYRLYSIIVLHHIT